MRINTIVKKDLCTQNLFIYKEFVTDIKICLFGFFDQTRNMHFLQSEQSQVSSLHNRHSLFKTHLLDGALRVFWSIWGIFCVIFMDGTF